MNDKSFKWIIIILASIITLAIVAGIGLYAFNALTTPKTDAQVQYETQVRQECSQWFKYSQYGMTGDKYEKYFCDCVINQFNKARETEKDTSDQFRYDKIKANLRLVEPICWNYAMQKVKGYM